MICTAERLRSSDQSLILRTPEEMRRKEKVHETNRKRGGRPDVVLVVYAAV